MTKKTVAALQIGSSPQGTRKTLDNILAYEDKIKASGASVVVVPEATLGGYPKGSTFETYVGYRLQGGREEFAEYFKQAISVPGPEIEELAGLSSRTGATLALGVIEKEYSTLYCTLVYIDPKKGYVGKHRKLMPTASERLIWGMGDGSTLPVIETEAGRIGGAICWENHMPLLRSAMCSKNIDVWVAPTVDEREIWRVCMRANAYENRMYLVSAVQIQSSPESLGKEFPGWDNSRNAINGGSVIIGPYGDILAGPLIGEEGLLTAEIDLSLLVEARYDFDPNGHYSRPDVFSLTVDERPKKNVNVIDK